MEKMSKENQREIKEIWKLFRETDREMKESDRKRKESYKEIVVVEVKTTLRQEDIKLFKKQLNSFKNWWPKFKDKTVYGALAFMKTDKETIRKAIKEGLLVIEATGDVTIQNRKGFKPKVFSE